MAFKGRLRIKMRLSSIFNVPRNSCIVGKGNQNSQGVRGEEKYLSLSLRESALSWPRVESCVRCGVVPRTDTRKNSSECVSPLSLLTVVVVRAANTVLLRLLQVPGKN